MKLRNLLPLAGLALSAASAYAVPAYPGLMTVKNPDGTTLQVRAFGDEHFNYFTDADQKYIISPDKDGFWRVEERNGRLLTATPEVVKTMRAEKGDFNIRFPMGVTSDRMRMASLDEEGRTTYQTEGEVHGLVILVEFADVPFSINNPQQTIDDFCNKEGFSEYGARGSAADYFHHVSNGKFQPVFDVSRVVKLKNNRSYYGGRDLMESRFCDLIWESVNELDAEIDFTKYDYDRDGIIDNIFFLFAGNGMADTSNPETIWPHQGHYYNFSEYAHMVPVLKPDGVKMATYACSNELKSPNSLPMGASSPWLDGIGTFVHEFGHVLGLPDLYDTASNPATATPKKYDVMDTGSYNVYSTCPPGYSAYEKWLCHWIELTEVEDGNVYELPSHSDGNDWMAYKIPVRRINASGSYREYPEWYIIETRTPDAWDFSMPADGMFIWHVDFANNKWVNNIVNYNGTSNCMMVPSSTKYGSQYAWPGINPRVTETYAGLDNAIEPNAYVPKFICNITGINYDAEAKKSTFEYNMVTEAPDYAPGLNSPAKSADGKEIVLFWTAPTQGDVQSYTVTVTRKNANGTVRIVDQCDEKNVGNVLTYNVRIPQTGTAAEDEYSAYVRAINYLPSTEVSNTQTFFLRDLPDASGVEAIEGEAAAPIYGSHGCVVAPADAEVYTLSGMRVGHDNLGAGIYLVRHQGRSLKVIVD